MSERPDLKVIVSHDEGEGIWFVLSSDIPGLVVEAPTYDALIEIVTDAAVDLVEANLPDYRGLPDASIPLNFQYHAKARRQAA